MSMFTLQQILGVKCAAKSTDINNNKGRDKGCQNLAAQFYTTSRISTPDSGNTADTFFNSQNELCWTEVIRKALSF